MNSGVFHLNAKMVALFLEKTRIKMKLAEYFPRAEIQMETDILNFGENSKPIQSHTIGLFGHIANLKDGEPDCLQIYDKALLLP